MGLLNWQQLLQDEGVLGTVRISWNILTHPSIRQRVMTMRHVFKQYQQELGYIILLAQRSMDR